MVGLTPQEKIQAKAEMAQRLKALQTNDAFQYLKSVVEKKRDLVFSVMAKSLLAGVQLDEVKLAYERGFWQGATHVLNRPDNAEKALDEALKRLANTEEDE